LNHTFSYLAQVSSLESSLIPSSVTVLSILCPYVILYVCSLVMIILYRAKRGNRVLLP